MSKGTINVSVDNIFPLIKKFLYSDHEIFLRELISNATDATLKLKHLTDIGEAKIEYGDPKIEIKIDKKSGTLHVMDQGLGMSEDEVQKYINEVAFSGAQEFIDKYKEGDKDSGIIGHFGLGFYSAFMVSDRVDIITKSYRKDAPAIKWSCDGSPEYTIEPHDKTERGTEIVLHIDKDSKDFLEDNRIDELLRKYNKFMPVPIQFGTREETKKVEKEEKEGDKKEDKKEDKITVPNIINNPNPAWVKRPADLKDEDYRQFYKELYPMQFENPLFHIHLNVDHPFHLTGILYFPKLDGTLNIQKERIQLYQNQVFVTDNVEGIVPEFLTLLRGIIDSPDIPLNVSRSYLQADGNVKKISNYISKKVADKLVSLFKKDRKAFEEKWNDIKIVLEYGMLSDDKFYDKIKNVAVFPTVDGSYYTFDELKEKTKDLQSDKDGKWIILYAANKDEQHTEITEAKERGYEVLLLDSPIISHLMQKLETKHEKIAFARVDSDPIDTLIKKDDAVVSKLSDKEKEDLKKMVEGAVSENQYHVQLESLNSQTMPFKITRPEFMRRMKDMQASGGGMFGMSNAPEMFNLVVNTNHELVGKLLSTKDEQERDKLIKQSLDLAKLSQGLLKGEELANFVKRSLELIG